MKKRFVLIIAAVLAILAFATACGGKGDGSGETYGNIAAQSNPYSMGSQSIEIIASSINIDDPDAKFKQSISASDIELGQALDGKTVTKVTYNSETSITVTLDGNTKVAGGENVYGSITVKQSGMKSKGKSTCLVIVRAPEIKYSCNVNSKTVGGVTTHNIIAKLSLPVGAFTDKAAECIKLADGVTGELAAALSDDGTLSVTIKNCNTVNPSIRFDADATTVFGKEITLKLASVSTATIK